MLELEAWHIWVIVGFVLFMAEIFIPGFVVGIFGLACLIAAPVAAAGAPLKVQLMVFGVATALITFAIRPLVIKYIYRPGHATRTNADAMIGQSGLVTEDIDADAGTGRIKVGGELWRAVTPDHSRIAAGQTVIVQKIEGCTLTVEAATDSERKSS